MASYEVQVASSSPFGCVLRDRSQQQSYRDSNGKVSRAAFKKNLKKFIREHLLIDENSQNHNTNSNVDSWVADRRPDANRPCLRPMKKNENGNDENSGNHKLARVAIKYADPNEATQSESQTPGASSLVQMWEARLQSIKTCSRTSSDVSCSDIGPSIANPPPADATIWDETLSPDCEAQSEKTGASDVPCPGPSAKGEKERVRIADIIKRLIKQGREENNGNEQKQEQVNNGESDLLCREGRLICTVAVTEPRGSFQLQQIVSSPRLRGRQAFNNLLMQIQRERHVELGSLAKRQAVSKFPQRGRIQSLLRLRSLQRCNAIQDQCRNQSVTSRSLEHSNIKSIRERFSENAHGLKSKAQQMSNKSKTSEAACTSSKVEQTGDQSTTASSFQAKQMARLERDEDCRPSVEQELDIIEKDGDFHEPTSNLESQEKKRDQSALSCSETPRERESESNGQHLQFLYFEHQQDTVVEAVTSWADHEMMQQDEDDYEPCYTGNSYDWISEIARPKSYWEDLRKTWYEQALATSENEDIRQLLERKTVSTFLTSEFKERMDKLMLARLQLEPAENAYGDDDEEDRSSQVIAFLQRQLRPHDDQERQEEQEEEEISPYFVTPSLSIQLPSPFMKSWSNQDHSDEAEESDQLFSSSPSDSPPVAHFQVESYRHNPRSSSSINHPSLEMELICDLKGQIEQLRSEMVELRKSVLSCIDLRMKMHQSMSTVKMKNTDSNERSACKRSCCMCHEMPVDSLLYSCGHMCTCMSCGQELQQNHRKCPMCKAAIADVVQAYFDA